MFNSNSQYPIGLDISDSSLKLVQLDKKRNVFKIQAIGKIDFTDKLLDRGEVINKENIVKAIKTIIEKPQYGKVSSNEAIVCLPESKTFIKLIEIEKTPNAIENIIEAEIEKHIPIAISDVYYDWQVIGGTRHHQLILTGVAPKKTIDQYTKILEEAGLSAVAFEIESIAICRSLLLEERPKFKGENKNYLIIDIGATRTGLTIYSKNTILFTISIPISGNEITKKIAESLKIDQAQAEKAKLICGLDEDKAQGVVKDILSGVMDDLASKISEAIDFYGNHFPDRGPIHQIILGGGGANIKKLNKIINEKLNINTIVGDPLTNLDGAKEDFSKILHSIKHSETVKRYQAKDKPSSLTNDFKASFSTAIGLSLRSLFLEE